MKITIGSDHGAVELKDAIKKVLAELDIEVNDVGTFGNDAVDYPDIAEKVCAEATLIKGLFYAARALEFLLRLIKFTEYVVRFVMTFTARKCHVNTMTLMFWQWAGV